MCDVVLHEEATCGYFDAPEQKPVGLENLNLLVQGQHQVGVSSQRLGDIVAMACSSVCRAGLVGFLVH